MHALRTLIILTAAAPFLIAAPAPIDVTVYPTAIDLTTRRDSQSVVVQARYADGITRDVTAQAQFKIDDGAVARLERHRLHPAKDGKTKLQVQFGGKTLQVPVTVSKAAEDRPISFRLDVEPVFTKAGCNSGACHGSSRGKDGFLLSLFGYDPASDYQRITHELAGRRLNLALPAESLLITKSLGSVQHSGGELIKKDSPMYRTLLRWLEAGAPDDPQDVATVAGIEIGPTQMVLNGKGATQQMVVLARYSDGTTRDVTSMAAFVSNNETSAEVSEHGVVTAAKRGEAYVMARYDAYTVGAQVIVLPKDLKFEWPKTPEANYVDTLVHEKLKKLRMLPSGLCDDATFLRRATLDVIGQLPTPEEHAAFMADKRPDKRERLIDSLLERKEFVELWVMKFAELLQIRSDNNVNQGISYKATVLYYNWLQEQLAANRPMNEIVRELLGSSGGTFSKPSTNFYQIERDTKKLTENIAQVFMGTRIQCAQCHNHPFDRWTMDDYYGFVSFFTQVGRKRAEDPREQIIYNRNNGEIKHPVGGRVMPPKFLGGAAPEVKGKDRREVLADWLASPDNPYFAPNLANIVWAHFFGKGIVDPVDDVRISNPPSNPQLLAELGKRFTDYKYDFKKLVRDICTSHAYQRSTATNETNALDTRNFARAYVRRVRAEILFDAISQVTDTMDQNKFKGLPRGARAVQIADGQVSSYFLTTFGRATRETVCSCEVSMEPNLSQALHLINGPTVHNKITSGKVVQKLIDEKLTDEQIVDKLYVRCLGRKPTKDDRHRIEPFLKAEGDRRQKLEDVFWALLNSQQFIFNH